MENKFIMVWVMGNSVDPCWFNSETNRPVLYDSKEEADQALAQDWEIDQRVQKEEVERGERDPDDIDQEPDYWITTCTVDENGCIRTPDDGLIYDPKTYVR